MEENAQNTPGPTPAQRAAWAAVKRAGSNKGALPELGVSMTQLRRLLRGYRLAAGLPPYTRPTTEHMPETCWAAWGEHGTVEQAALRLELSKAQVQTYINRYRDQRGLPQSARPVKHERGGTQTAEARLDHLLACLEVQAQRGNRSGVESIRRTMHELEREFYGWGLE